jgi:hypothetical protein
MVQSEGKVKKICYNSPTNTFKKKAIPKKTLKTIPESFSDAHAQKRRKKCTFAIKQEVRARLERLR